MKLRLKSALPLLSILILCSCVTPTSSNGLVYGVQKEGGGFYSISEMSTYGMNINIQQAVKQCESEGKTMKIISQGQKTGMVSSRQYNQLIFKCK